MPQTSPEVQDAIDQLLGPSNDREPLMQDVSAVNFLKARGWVLTPQWCWKMPEGHEPTSDELLCVQYLIEEWDFGGIV